MRLSIPIAVTAKNEALSIRRMLESLTRSTALATQALGVDFDVRVVLDDCTDETEAQVSTLGIPSVHSSGGKVEAQRRGLRLGPFQIFCDADIELEPNVVTELCRVMLESPNIQAAFPRKQPLPPRRRTPLAWALHVYNRRRGFSSKQSWFSGKLFALRQWNIPRASELHAPRGDPFFRYELGIRADDIYLSRSICQSHGAAALREVNALIWYRAPETWEGMYRYYRRLRIELERTSVLAPMDAPPATRETDLLLSASFSERVAHEVFRAALLACRARYLLERRYYQRLARTPCDAWPPVEETKCL